MYRIYGRYLGRVRHSLLRRPYLFEEKWGVPARLYEYTDYLSLLRLPSVVVDLEKYIAEVIKPSYLVDDVIWAANIIPPSKPHAPICLYYTDLGTCDYLTTIIASAVLRPVKIHEETDITLYLERNPTTIEQTKYQVAVRRRPSVVELEEYIAKIARFIEVVNNISYAARVYRTYPVIAITRYQMLAQRLPVVEETSDIQAELTYGGYSEIRLKGIHTKVVEGLTAYNNVFILTPINTVVQYIPQSLIIGIDYTTNEQLSIIPKVELIGGYIKDHTLIAYRPNVVVKTAIVTTLYPHLVLIAKYPVEHTHFIAPARVFDYVNVRYLSRYTGVNLSLTSYSSIEARTELFLKSRHDKLYEPIVFSEDLFVVTNQFIRQEPAVVLVNRYRPATAVEVAYAPIIVLDYNKLYAVYTPQVITIDTYNRVYVAPYVTLKSSYRIIYELYATLITQEYIRTTTSDAVVVKRIYNPNVVDVAEVSTSLWPYYVLSSHYSSESLPYIDSVNLYEYSYTTLDIHHWTGQQLIFLKGGAVPYSYYVEISPVNLIRSVTYASIAFYPHYELWLTTNTTLYPKLGRVVAVTTQTSTSTIHYKAVEQYVNAYTNSQLSASVSRQIRLSDTQTSKAAVSRHIVELVPVALSARYAQQNVLLTAVTFIVAQYLKHNVLQETPGYYTVALYGTNISHLLQSDYALTLERYGSVAVTLSDYVISTYSTNIRHSSESSAVVQIYQSNVAHNTESLATLRFYGSNVAHETDSNYIVRAVAPNAKHDVYGDYTLAIYVQLKLKGDVSSKSDYSVYNIYKLAGSINGKSQYAIQLSKAAIDVTVDLDVEASQYVR